MKEDLEVTRRDFMRTAALVGDQPGAHGEEGDPEAGGRRFQQRGRPVGRLCDTLQRAGDYDECAGARCGGCAIELGNV